ncbi:MAG: hypothetical protein RLY58_2048 [Pseudomonadota bacterium]
MLTDQANFLRFIKCDDFQPDEFHNFLEEFDINQADFLAWIEHNQAPWQYFHFYVLLVKNYLNDQHSIQPIIDFAFSKNSYGIGSLLNILQYPQKKYPNVLDMQKFEHMLLDYIKQHSLDDLSSQLESLLPCYNHSHYFHQIAAYVCQNLQVDHASLIRATVGYCRGRDHDYGVLQKLSDFIEQKNFICTEYDLRLWATQTKHCDIRGKISTLSLKALERLLRDPSQYHAENFVKYEFRRSEQPIIYHIGLLKNIHSTAASNLLSQIIENERLYILIRFEAVFTYFQKNKTHHPLKSSITQTTLSGRWRLIEENHTIANDYDLFQASDFFTLDEVLLATNIQQWCYKASRFLHLYGDEKQQKPVFNDLLNSIANETQKLLKEEDYQCMSLHFNQISCLCHALIQNGITPPQRQQLEAQLLNALQQCSTHLSNPEFIQRKLVSLVYSLNMKIPTEYFELLGTWSQLEITWQDKNIDLESIWQQLLDAKVIEHDAIFDDRQNFFGQFFRNLHYTYYDRKDDTPFHDTVFSYFFSESVKWVFEENLDTSQLESIIDINHVNDDLDWKYIEYFYFLYQDKYYRFFIYALSHSLSIDQQSILYVCNQILRTFDSDIAIYVLEGDVYDAFGYDFVCFSAHRLKFEACNQSGLIPCHSPRFFTPISKSLAFLEIQDEFQSIVQAGGFASAIDGDFIAIPKYPLITSKEAQAWLLSMIDEMVSRTHKQSLEISNQVEQAVNVRNLFVSLALNMIIRYPATVESLKRKYPLLQKTDFSADSCNLQPAQVLDRIFDKEALSMNLQYPQAGLSLS